MNAACSTVHNGSLLGGNGEENLFWEHMQELYDAICSVVKVLISFFFPSIIRFYLEANFPKPPHLHVRLRVTKSS